jgi:hypothetical protein
LDFSEDLSKQFNHSKTNDRQLHKQQQDEVKRKVKEMTKGHNMIMYADVPKAIKTMFTLLLNKSVKMTQRSEQRQKYHINKKLKKQYSLASSIS